MPGAPCGFTLFHTPIGRCGIAWGERGIVAVQLPEGTDGETQARLLELATGVREEAPPPGVQRAIDGIVALLGGEAGELSDVVLDMEGLPPFHRRVYEAARTIPPGATVTYGELAAGCGAPGAARAVGQALARNPFAIVVPCHRVLAAGSRAGGFSANGGVGTKLRLLSIEGVEVKGASGAGGGAGGGERAGAGREGGDRAGAEAAGTGTGFDPQVAATHLRAADPQLGRLIDASGPFDLPLDRAPSLFLALAQAIVYQQLSGKAASTIFGRLRALFPEGPDGLTAERILDASDDALRGAGLSRGKLLALRDLAGRTAAGELPTLTEVQRLEDEAIIERVTRVRGIGRWTVEMVLIFRLGRPDVLPADDYGIRKGFAAAFRTDGLPDRKDVEARGQRWKPYRTMASLYLWRAAEQGPA